MSFCTKCGQKLNDGAKFCSHCGAAIAADIPKAVTPVKSSKTTLKTSSTVDFNGINTQISLQNSQSNIVKRSRYAAILFFVLMVLPFQEWSPFTGFWAMAFISFFLFLSSLIIGYMFKSREKKLQTLINGDNLIAHWVLNSELKAHYIQTLYKNEVQKNMGILLVIGVIAAVVFGIFILVIDEGKLAMFLVYLGLLVFLSIFAFGMPLYYRYQNNKNDGQILIGAKYAYINGYFHNWDFPLSGIKKARIIDQPFYGLYIKYYYTDRTLTNTEVLNIPAPKDVDLNSVLAALNG